MKRRPPTVIHAAAARDAAGIDARPGSVLVQEGRVVAAGDPRSLPAELVAQAEVIDRSGCLLLPAMVNAHTHLELTTIGPQPYDPAGGFVGWVKMLRSLGPRIAPRDGLPDQGARIDFVAEGVAAGTVRLRESGVQAVGDITSLSGSDDAWRRAGIMGAAYLELFGMGPPHDAAARRAIQETGCGLQPHAPYSAGPELYAAAARSGRPIATHLAETRDEAAFVGQLTGAKYDFIRSIGRWDDAFAGHYGHGQSPVQWMRPHLEAAADAGGWLVAHCNYVSDEDIAILAGTNTSVAYCPIASEYFGHTGHRYRDMLAAGVNVCLGTDSIVCAAPTDPQPLSLLSAMRRLYQRDRADPETLLKMATVNGAKALRLDRTAATLLPKAPARFMCVPFDPDQPADPLEQVLAGQVPAEPLSFDDRCI